MCLLWEGTVCQLDYKNFCFWIIAYAFDLAKIFSSKIVLDKKIFDPKFYFEKLI